MKEDANLVENSLDLFSFRLQTLKNKKDLDLIRANNRIKLMTKNKILNSKKIDMLSSSVTVNKWLKDHFEIKNEGVKTNSRKFLPLSDHKKEVVETKKGLLLDQKSY